ncbi:MAG: signal peptidase II [Clostridia bacterium]|nr:signal peptidase II [Clostridia bacterium]
MSENKLLNEKDGGRYSMKGSRWWGVWIFLILVFIDQLTKLFAQVYFEAAGAPQSVPIIKGWIELTLTHNRGISYGMGANAPEWAKILVVAVTGVMMTALAILYFKLDKRRVWLRTALVFVVAGGVGNLIDRVYYRVWVTGGAGGVRDMVDLSRFGFAVCNFADFFISAGAVMLVLAMLFLDPIALFPATKKYKDMAADADAIEQAKKEARSAQKQAKNG